MIRLPGGRVSSRALAAVLTLTTFASAGAQETPTERAVAKDIIQ